MPSLGSDGNHTEWELIADEMDTILHPNTAAPVLQGQKNATRASSVGIARVELLRENGVLTEVTLAQPRASWTAESSD